MSSTRRGSQQGARKTDHLDLLFEAWEVAPGERDRLRRSVLQANIAPHDPEAPLLVSHLLAKDAARAFAPLPESVRLAAFDGAEKALGMHQRAVEEVIGRRLREMMILEFDRASWRLTANTIRRSFGALLLTALLFGFIGFGIGKGSAADIAERLEATARQPWAGSWLELAELNRFDVGEAIRKRCRGENVYPFDGGLACDVPVAIRLDDGVAAAAPGSAGRTFETARDVARRVNAFDPWVMLVTGLLAGALAAVFVHRWRD